MIIASQAYGDRTSALQAIVAQAEATSLFDAKLTSIDEQRVWNDFREHAARMAAHHAGLLTPTDVEILRGPAAVLLAHWTTGVQWREELGVAIGDLHRRFAAPPLSDRLQPPIWPAAGLVNVFGATFVATEQTHRRCQAVSKTPQEAETCWAATCFVEKIVDAALVSELFADIEPNNAFSPLLAVCASNVIPIGWKQGKPTTFLLYAFESGSGGGIGVS